MNKRDLRKALDAHAAKDDASSGRRLAYLFAAAAASGRRTPRALREPLRKAAMACLACDAFDAAPAGTRAFSDLYREREWAFAQFGDACLVHLRRARKTKPETDGELMSDDDNGRPRAMRVAPGVADMLGHANRKDPGYTIIVGYGDLTQMAAQYRFLQTAGIDVGRLDVYPAVRDAEARLRALRAMWEARVDGWWNARQDLVPAICSEEQFKAALDQTLGSRG